MRFTSYLTAGALAALTSAQTFTDCDPLKKVCPNDPAIAATFETNFKAGKDAVKGWKQTAGSLNYVAEGAEFTIKQTGEAPTIQTDGYLQFGYIEVKAKAAPGQGIITALVLQSEAGDEVDWEFLGSVQNQVQMNYFGKRNTSAYDRMIPGTVSNTLEMHTYALNWTAESLTWIIDNNPVRTLKYADANGGKNYPQTPSNVRLGIWAGGDSTDEGTVQWAGGKVDYSKAPFTMTVESVKIINYSPGTEYKYTDMSGSYESIEVIGAGNKEGSPTNSAVIEASASGSGSGLATGLHPTATVGGEFHENPSGTGAVAESTPCSEGEQMSSSTPAPVISTVPATATPAESTPCSESEQVPSSVAAPFTSIVTTATPAESTPCSEGEQTPSSAAAPFTSTVVINQPQPPASGTPVSSPPTEETQPPASGTPASNPPTEETPCSCGIATVTVTGPSPPPETPTAEIPASSSPEASSIQTEQPPVSSGTPAVPPPVTVPASSAPPYPTTPGLVTDTAPAPSVPYPSAPTGALPGGGNSTTTAPPSQFTGAASHNKAGALVGAIAGAVLLAF